MICCFTTHEPDLFNVSDNTRIHFFTEIAGYLRKLVKSSQSNLANETGRSLRKVWMHSRSNEPSHHGWIGLLSQALWKI